MARRKADLKFFETTYAEPFDDPEKALTQDLVNFQTVSAGQALHAPGSPPLITPNSGFILFPKYPARSEGRAVAPWPNEIYRLVTPMKDHPMDLWESPEEA